MSRGFLRMQGVLDFCNQLSFIRNVYLNLDCRIERNNLFEAIASLLSKTAFPVNCPLGSVHLLSLEGLFSILSALSAS
jgi:golgi-specific brefeldin A-resistance guanine nucleotide exchange factor 1